jgi:hypothetical protein
MWKHRKNVQFGEGLAKMKAMNVAKKEIKGYGMTLLDCWNTFGRATESQDMNGCDAFKERLGDNHALCREPIFESCMQKDYPRFGA